MNNPRRFAALLVLLLASGCAFSPIKEHTGLGRRGMAYELRLLREPRPVRAHILRVDLGAARVAPAVASLPDPDGDGPAETVLTDPLELVKGRKAVAFVNANCWGGLGGPDGKIDTRWREGQPVKMGGLVVTNGVLRSGPEPAYAQLRFPKRGRPVIEEKSASTAAVEAIAGFQQLVREGERLTQPGGPLAPRTAAGLDAEGRTLWLVVVDGRQPGFSEGMTVDELARLMQELGCADATNLDGGGSSIMGIRDEAGVMRVVNRPSDRRGQEVRIRPLPVVLMLETVGTSG